MSQINLHKIIRQQQEQLAAMQAQIQALLAVQGGAGGGGAERGSTGPKVEVAMPGSESGGFHHGMQIICEDEVKGSHGRRAGAVGFVVCAGRISRCVEGECNGRVRVRRGGV